MGINICAGYIVFALRDVHVWTDKNISTFTLEAFRAGGGDTVLPLRGRPQLRGHGGDIQDVFSLYMFRTLPRRNKRPSHRNFLCCPPAPPVRCRRGLSLSHTPSLSDISSSVFASRSSQSPRRLRSFVCCVYCLRSCSTDRRRRLINRRRGFNATSHTHENSLT